MTQLLQRVDERPNGLIEPITFLNGGAVPTFLE